MKRGLAFALVILLVAVVIRERRFRRAPRVYTLTSGRVDMCLACHRESPGRAHARGVVGCADCHLGDPLTVEKERAHRGMVKNPADLRLADRTCGRPECHPGYGRRVKKSLMATNRGIITTLRYYWGEIKDFGAEASVEALMKSGESSPALDYFRKLCGTCHLWLPREKLPGFLREKGGGCAACHLVPGKGPGKRPHPVLTRRIPVKNCARCHNRSGRIGLSYQGLYENEQYGAPIREGTFGAEELADGRFVSRIPPDVHYKAGMSCVDCHVQNETMGDGRSYAHLEESVEITCETCHGGDGKTRKGTRLSNLVRRNGKLYLRAKLTGKLLLIKPPDPVACRHRVHRRLACYACHDRRVPQCFGCHVRRDPRERQLDKLSFRKTAGLWEEFRSYMRLTRPTLGLYRNRVEILVPG
ncbi:hypothetical protein [Thermosulfurimonas sp. F29]|uniref:hypothetical protein n=1 Tax=Thermosulfurimonas sp. F29 TaxID=2867247 RepID=UPI001C83D14E|nr:hypothetical protein [Thermosulfurimonas sp. F29]MBX6422415.1 hypothetical protein [Thermosulfurimonas sp. F29]